MFAKRQYLGSMPDRISNLPDAILLHILSFLPIKDAINTSVLSKKWDNLWAQLPSLDLGSCSMNFINHALILHQAPKVHRLSLHVEYRQKFESNIYAWFHFAVKRHVEELRFTMYKSRMRISRDCPLELPLYVYRNARLKELELSCFCFYNMKSVNWQLLRSLSLKEIDNLSDEKLNMILSGSPLLEKLVILEGYKLKSVNLSGRKVKSLCLGYLNVFGGNGEGLKLCIPNVSSLSLCGELDSCEDYIFEDRSCTWLERVELGFELLIDHDDNQWSKKLVRDSHNNRLRKELDEMPFKKLLRIVDDLSHVEVLSVKYQCLQMFSVMETINLSLSTSKRKCLTVETGLRKWELPGICHLLRSSPELEELTLKVIPSSFVYIQEDIQKKRHFKKVDYLESQMATLQSLSQKLKIIKLHSIIGSEGKLGYGCVRWENDQLPKQSQKEMELVKFLLKHACVLEEIIIYIKKKENIGRAKMRELLFNMFEDLFQFPRASPHAKVKFL